MKNLFHILTVVIGISLLLASCNKTYNYHVKGIVVKATKQEPLEGVVVELYHEVCTGGIFTGGCGPDEIHSATTNTKGEFEMAFISEESGLKVKLSKQHMYYYSGVSGVVYNYQNNLDTLAMYVQTEEFTIEFEPTLPNVKEVMLGLEWDRFSGGNVMRTTLGPYPSHFGIANHYNYPYEVIYFTYGEQWIIMNFDILLDDNSRLQKTDSIWLPGRYYDINDYEFGDPRKYPVYKFNY